MGAGHSHEHSRSPRSIFKLKIALGLTFLYMLAEAIGGWLANSLALIADAGHMLTDVAALCLTLLAFRFASRPATSKKTYGYYRLEILAAFVNGVVLVVLSLWIVYEAYERWTSAPEVKGPEMLVVAAGGLIVNFIALMLLHSDSGENLNMLGAWLHIVGDLLGSVAAIIAGLAIIFFGYIWADALTSVIISVIIIASSWRLILNSVNVLLEGTPAHINMRSLQRSILETPGVTGVHDLHVWTISSGMEALSAHISHDRSQGHSELLALVRDRLHDEFGIDHLTIQMETAEREAEAVYVCETGTRCFIPSNEHSGEHG